MTTTEVASPNPAELRSAMGAFATGVTVITGLEAGEPVGFACQSFASVSLDPALVLFCADHRGRAWPRIRTTGRFTVNVLGEDQVDLCNRFGSSRGQKYTGLAWERSAYDTPSLPDVLMRVHGEVFEVQQAGDHDVVIGRVLGLDTCSAGRPMLFFRGSFGIEHQTEHPAPSRWGWGDHWG